MLALAHGTIRAVVLMRARARRADRCGPLRAPPTPEPNPDISKLPWPKSPASLLTLKPTDPTSPGRLRGRPSLGRAERHIVRACGACSYGSQPGHRATTPPSEPRCDRNRTATSGLGGAVARESPAVLRRRGQKFRRRELHKARCFERPLLGGPHARPCLRSRRLRPPAVRAEARPGGTAQVRRVNDRGFGCRPRGEGPCLQRRGDLHVGPDWGGPA
jgi:hypothetical protein